MDPEPRRNGFLPQRRNRSEDGDDRPPRRLRLTEASEEPSHQGHAPRVSSEELLDSGQELRASHLAVRDTREDLARLEGEHRLVDMLGRLNRSEAERARMHARAERQRHWVRIRSIGARSSMSSQKWTPSRSTESDTTPTFYPGVRHCIKKGIKLERKGILFPCDLLP